jgi:DNA replication and repair protein RecF
MGFISIVFFAPNDLSIIQGSPSVRRRFIDLSICQMSKKYFHLISTYNRILTQKNKLLKFDNATEHLDMLEVWNAGLAENGGKINIFREEYIRELNLRAKIHFGNMIQKDLELSYIPNGNGILDNLEREMKKAIKKEIKYHQAEIGPHRDDVEIKINDKAAKDFSSQGQQRAAVIAFKKAQFDILSDRIDEPPILLLDDVLSELDTNRQMAILDEKLTACQTIITATKSKNANIILGDN